MLLNEFSFIDNVYDQCKLCFQDITGMLEKQRRAKHLHQDFNSAVLQKNNKIT